MNVIAHLNHNVNIRVHFEPLMIITTICLSPHKKKRKKNRLSTFTHVLFLSSSKSIY